MATAATDVNPRKRTLEEATKDDAEPKDAEKAKEAEPGKEDK